MMRRPVDLRRVCVVAWRSACVCRRVRPEVLGAERGGLSPAGNGLLVRVGQWYPEGRPGRRIGLRWEPTRAPTQGPRPKGGRQELCAAHLSSPLRDWHQRDKSLAAQPRVSGQKTAFGPGDVLPGRGISGRLVLHFRLNQDRRRRRALAGRAWPTLYRRPNTKPHGQAEPPLGVSPAAWCCFFRMLCGRRLRYARSLYFAYRSAR